MKIIDCNIEKARQEGQQAHNIRVKHDREYLKRWILKNGTAQNLRNSNRPSITLARLAFMDRPELFPEI